MPGPAVYVVAAIATVGAVIAFKQFVYDPHIAPQFDRFVDEIQANRRRRRQGPIAVELSDSYTNERDGRRSSNNARSNRRTNPSDTDTDNDSDVERYGRPEGSRHRSSGDIELEPLVARDVQEWRRTDGLRHRRTNPAGTSSPSTSALDESNSTIPFTPITPTRSTRDYPSHHSTASTGSTSTRPVPPPTDIAPLQTTHIIHDSSTPLTPTTPSTARTASVPLPPLHPMVPCPMPEGSPARSPPPSSNADWRSSTHARGDAPADSMLFRTEVDAHDPFDESTLPTPIAREHPTHAQLNEEDRDRSTSDLSSLVTSPPLPALPSVTQSQPGVSSRSVTPVQQSPPTPPRAVRYSPAELAKALPSPPTAPPAGSSTSTSEYATPVAPTPPVTISFPSPRVGRFDVGEAGSVPSSVNSARTIVLADRSVDGEEQTSTSPPLPPLPSTPPATAGSSSLASRIATTPPPLASLRSEPSSFASRSSQLGSYGQGPSPLPSLPSSPSIPSLSQIYAPQDPKLDYEHNVVLLSPPSSRSESPFSVVSSVDGVGSPFVGFGALGLGNEGQGTSSTEAGARGMASPNAVFSVPASPSTPGSTTSNYISLPASNPGSPRLGGQPALTTSISPPNATIAESVYFDASYPHVASSTSPLVSSQSTEPTSPPSSNPFADPVTETSTTLPRPQSRSRSHSPALSSTPSTPRTALSAMESSLSDFESDLDNDVEREFTTLRSSTTIPARETSGSDVSPFASPRQPRPIANTSKNTTTTVQRRHQHDLEDDSGMISETDSLSSWASVGAGSGSN